MSNTVHPLINTILLIVNLRFGPGIRNATGTDARSRSDQVETYQPGRFRSNYWTELGRVGPRPIDLAYN
ncbi:unnamed protein product [Didymodactylos carnosus]|uniref:Uncharacterized protein n=1 Tax=Didymodactylos carnosus TaxID=1234261 RepID=A0A815IIK5_9BILA|nr:unnamed protein product [Didymodactylos carnosus]CAF1510092.1 unnamed protein product [Didymodactylos carnosus]CAF4253456.1 unnamed protein product [Didymodactylos carnosus]CAF4297951.1 unnamed protein product [Didymodactylos carnosus]